MGTAWRGKVGCGNFDFFRRAPVPRFFLFWRCSLAILMAVMEMEMARDEIFAGLPRHRVSWWNWLKCWKWRGKGRGGKE